MHIDADLLSHIDHPNVFVEKKKNQKKLLNSFDEWYQLYALISYTLAPGGYHYIDGKGDFNDQLL